MVTEITKGQLLVMQLGRLKDQRYIYAGPGIHGKNEQCQYCHINCPNRPNHLGANNIMGEYPIMRHANNLEAVFTNEGTHDMHLLVIGQEVTGIAAYRG